MIRERGSVRIVRRGTPLPEVVNQSSVQASPSGVAGFGPWNSRTSHQILQRAADAVLPPRDQRDAGAADGRRRHAAQGTRPLRPGGVLGERSQPSALWTVALQFESLVARRGAGAADQQRFCPDCPENASNHTMTFGPGYRMAGPDSPGSGASHARGAAYCTQILRISNTPATYGTVNREDAALLTLTPQPQTPPSPCKP